MKFIAILWGVELFLNLAINSEKSPRISTHQKEYVCQVMADEKVLKQEFWLRNNGNMPLVIRSVRNPRGDCVVDWPRDPIAVGDSALAVFHSMRKATRVFTEPVSIDCNDSENATWIVRFKVLPVEMEQERTSE